MCRGVNSKKWNNWRIKIVGLFNVLIHNYICWVKIVFLSFVENISFLLVLIVVFNFP